MEFWIETEVEIYFAAFANEETSVASIKRSWTLEQSQTALNCPAIWWQAAIG